MKICHITSVHSYKDTRIFIKESKSLARYGYETHLIAPNSPEGIIDGVHLHEIKKSLGSRWTRMTKTAWAVYKAAKRVNANIYHFHDPELIPIGLLFKLKGKKVIYDVHEDVPKDILSKTWIPGPLRKIIAVCFEKFENITSKFFDGIVTATPHIKDRFSALNKESVDVNNYPIADELYLPGIDWFQKERAVCYMGGINQMRGIFEMVESIGKTDVKLILGGSFTFLDERKKVMELDSWSNVHELGFLDRDEISKALSRSMAGLVVLHPLDNYLDALPVKMFEYMSAGIPVIASNFPLWKEIVDGNQCGICVDPLDPEKIAKAIQWIVDHPEEARKMGENGRKAVEEKYNWEQEFKKLKQLYMELI